MPPLPLKLLGSGPGPTALGFKVVPALHGVPGDVQRLVAPPHATTALKAAQNARERVTDPLKPRRHPHKPEPAPREVYKLSPSVRYASS